jgi:AcrR family transcriptional regulator
VGTKERRTRERQETRDLILSAAREMFAAEGYDAVTMRAIAREIEYTPTAIYHHFENKQALLSELCQCDFEGLARHFQGHATSTDPVERILAVGEAYLRFAEQYPSQYRFMFMTVLPRPEHDQQYITESRDNPERNAYAFLRDACRAAIDAGRFRTEVDDPDQLAQILWGTVHGLISLRIAKRDHDWVPWRELRSTARAAMQILMRGILRESLAEESRS